MANLIYEVTDAALYDESSNYQFKAALVLGLDSASILVTNEDKLMAFRSYSFHKRNFFDLADAFQALYAQEKLLSLSFRQVDVALAHKSFTFVPDELFDANKLELYLQNVVEPPINDLIQIDVLASRAAKTIYTLNSNLRNILREKYETVKIQHIMSPTINALSQHQSKLETKHDTLYIHLRDQTLQVVCFREGEFVFANYFEYQSSNDVAYYMMLVINQLSLKQQDVRVVLSGQLERKSEIYTTLYRYIQKIDFLDYPSPYHVPTSFDQLSRHVFFDTLTIL
jgi:hypothetical protein